MLADLIQKLVSKGKHLLAVKFISEFGLTDKFPPVPILKSYVKESKKLAKKVCKDGNNSRQSMVFSPFSHMLPNSCQNLMLHLHILHNIFFCRMKPQQKNPAL